MFRINPEQWGPHRDLHQDFGLLVEDINAVNHGEFEEAVRMLMQQASIGDACGKERPSALVLQRCRRGGKTFMLHAIASRLSNAVDDHTHVIFLSMNSDSRYLHGAEDAYQAILGRIAYEYTGSSLRIDYDRFTERYTDFGDVADWVRRNKVILVIDELNVIPPDAHGYQRMSNFLGRACGAERQFPRLLDSFAGDERSSSQSIGRREWIGFPS